MNEEFNKLLQASFKSEDTEEWLDVHFTRPIGLVFALFWNKLGVHPNARYDNTFLISSSGLRSLAFDKLERHQVEDVAYFEPYYLKDFVAKKSVVRGLH